LNRAKQAIAANDLDPAVIVTGVDLCVAQKIPKLPAAE